jgi:hypothetical protein
MVRARSLAGGRERSGIRHAVTRLTAGFEYIGPALDRRQAVRLYQTISPRATRMATPVA